MVYRRTLRREVACTGIGLHCGRPVRLRLLPAPAEHGIRYLDGERQVDAEFRSGPGRGVRRIALHAALLEAVTAAGVRVVHRYIGAVTQDGATVRVGELRARYLAAADGLQIERLAVLEPPLAFEPEPEDETLGDEVAELVAAGRRGDAFIHFNRSIGVPEEYLEGMRDAPWWPAA